MEISNLGDIKAVAFDIDGTLYRGGKFYFKMTPHFLCHSIFFLKYGLVRKDLRKIEIKGSFDDVQAEFMAKRLHCTPEEAKERLDKIVYTGLKKYFVKLKPCSGALELIKKLKAAGLKVAVLSDFPPEQKGDIWGILPYCDLALGTEEVGALKPSSRPFTALSEKLDVPLDQILYVGNSHKYDVEGPKAIGMKAAWIISPLKDFFGKKSKVADFTFGKYSQLDKYIFKN